MMSFLCIAVLSSVAIARSATDRVPVPGQQGCNAITLRSTCCLYVDGRQDVTYGGQPCVAAKEGMSFDVGVPGVVCQPSCWAYGTCGNAVDQSDRVGSCSAAGSGMWHLMGKDKACRADTNDHTTNGRGTAEVVSSVLDLAACQAICSAAPVCHGVEFHSRTQRCEVWTKGVGFAIYSPGFECWAHVPFGSPGVVEQEDATIPIGGALRFYAVGSSNAAWQTWPDQMHAMLKDLGYSMRLPRTTIPGELTQPATTKTPVCMDVDLYSSLHTPRLGMIGWSSWGFAYESTDDCNSEGFREIAGYPVKCTNAWACNPAWTGSFPLVPISILSTEVSDADVVVLANWINDAKSAQNSRAREVCYNNSDIQPLDSTAITEVNLQRIIRAVHAQNPKVMVFVFARYPDTQQTIYPNERTLPYVTALNNKVKELVEGEPNTFWVDLTFPLGENMFQTLSKVHPNCRGDKVMASSLIDAMFKHKLLSRGLALGDSETCLGSSTCSTLSIPCCQRSALCYVDASGACASYSPGMQ